MEWIHGVGQRVGQTNDREQSCLQSYDGLASARCKLLTTVKVSMGAIMAGDGVPA